MCRLKSKRQCTLQKMGYCAKARILSHSHITCVIAMLVLSLCINGVQCGNSKVPGKTYPNLKSYDIWDSDTDKNSEAADQQRNTFTASDDDVLLQDYGEKTSFRNGKVINFFAQPNADECKSEDGLRSGVCMNVYDCHQKGGTSKGQCALGFGVCCVFVATCNQDIKNNITYFISPNFPTLMSSHMKTCKIKIKMMSSDISQLRFDFVHFSIGQPNRQNGNCDGDVFSLSGGASGDFHVCGYNNGQHIYYDVPNRKARQDKSKPADIDLIMNFTNTFATARFWEVRVTQIPFSQRAPAGCLQYFFGNDGIIQTFNFAENGRHLSNQRYKSCVRQARGMCSISYEPCTGNSFRIGPTRQVSPYQSQLIPTYPNYPVGGSYPYQASPYQANPYQANPYYQNAALGNPILTPNGIVVPNPYGPPGILPPNRIVYDANGNPSIIDPNGMLVPVNPNALGVPNGVPFNGMPNGGIPPQQDQMPVPAMNDASPNATATNTTTTTTTSTTARPDEYDEVEGSGDEDDDTNAQNDGSNNNNNNNREEDITSLLSIGSFITRAALFRRSLDATGQNSRHSKQFFSSCDDRITLPCIVEDFISVGSSSVPSCSPVHCGSSLCPRGTQPCRVESTVTPFAIGINFGQGTFKGNAEENIGACLRYKQLNCV